MLRRTRLSVALLIYCAAMAGLIGMFIVQGINHADIFVFVIAALVAGHLYFSSEELYLLMRGKAKDTAPREAHKTTIVLFVENEDIDMLRIVFLSLRELKSSRNVFVVCNDLRYDLTSLCEEFSFEHGDTWAHKKKDADNILFTNGYSVLYPDALHVAYRRMTDTVDYVELNHDAHSSRRLSGAGTREHTRTTQVARALASHGVAYFTGGPILVRAALAKKVIKDVKRIGSFDTVSSLCMRFSTSGAITAHPCCECMSQNEIDINTAARINFLRVSRQLLFHRSRIVRPAKHKRTLRARRSRLYIALAWTRPLLTLATAGAILFSMTTSLPRIVVDPVFVALMLSAVALRSCVSRMVNDPRRITDRVRDSLLDCEALLVAFVGHVRSQRRVSVHFRFTPGYLVLLSAMLVYRVANIRDIYDPHHTKLFVATSIWSIGICWLTYRAIARYVGSRQRSFARRSVSITGSSSYESMWIVDLTHRGAAYVSDFALELGDETPLVFRVPTVKGDHLVTVVGRVTYCGPRGDKYQVGVAFRELSQESHDVLATYCSVLYPYQQARHIQTREITLAAGPRRPRFTWPRNALTAALGLVVVTTLLATTLMVIPRTIEKSTYRTRPVSLRLRNAASPIPQGTTLIPRQTHEAEPVVTRNYETVPAPDLTVKTNIVDLPKSGYRVGDSVKVQVVVSNIGTRPVEGLSVKAAIGDGFDTENATIVSAGGFSPCGIVDGDLACQTLKAFPAGHTSTIEVSLPVMRVSGASSTRLIAASVKPLRNDSNEQPHENNSTVVAAPLGTGAALGGRAYVDANNNSVYDSGELGIRDVKVALYRASDNTIVARDTTDKYGFYGLARGTKNFNDLSGDAEYFVKFSGGNKDLVALAPQSPRKLLAANEKDLSFNMGFVTKARTVRVSLLHNKVPVSGLTVRLVREGTPDKVVATAKTTSGGAVEFSNVTGGTDITKWHIETDIAKEYELSGSEFRFDNSAPGTAVGRSRPLAQLPQSSVIQLVTRRSTINGHVYGDINMDGVHNASERGVGGVEVILSTSVNKKVSATISNREGKYSFADIASGCYFVSFTPNSLPSNTVIATKPVKTCIEVTPGNTASYPVQAVSIHASRFDVTTEIHKTSYYLELLHGKIRDGAITPSETERSMKIVDIAAAAGLIMVVIVLMRRRKLFVRVF